MSSEWTDVGNERPGVTVGHAEGGKWALRAFEESSLFAHLLYYFVCSCCFKMRETWTSFANDAMDQKRERQKLKGKEKEEMVDA